MLHYPKFSELCKTYPTTPVFIYTPKKPVEIDTVCQDGNNLILLSAKNTDEKYLKNLQILPHKNVDTNAKSLENNSKTIQDTERYYSEFISVWVADNGKIQPCNGYAYKHNNLYFLPANHSIESY